MATETQKGIHQDQRKSKRILNIKKSEYLSKTKNLDDSEKKLPQNVSKQSKNKKSQYKLKTTNCDAELSLHNTVISDIANDRNIILELGLQNHGQDDQKNNDALRCGLCDSTFSTTESLITHLSICHSTLKPFKCGVCKAGFFENDDLLQHVNSNHEKLKSLYKCNLCLQAFDKLMLLKDHVFECHRISVLNSNNLQSNNECCAYATDEEELFLHQVSNVKNIQIIENHRPELNAVYKDKQKLTKLDTASDKFQHENYSKPAKEIDVNIEEYREGSIYCGNDPKATKRKGKANNRVIKHSSSISLETKSKSVHRDNDLLIHTNLRRDVNSGSQFYDCDVCGERLYNNDLFVEHRREHFVDGKFSIFCKHCLSSFSSFEALNDHIGPDKCSGYQCNNCSKSFSLEPLLLMHQAKAHSDDGDQTVNMICTICSKRYESSVALYRHASSHAEDKCINCNLCRHSFTTQESLLCHMRLYHSVISIIRQQYKFCCEVCPAKFIKLDALIKHLSSMHDVVKNNNVTDIKPASTKMKTPNTQPKPKIKSVKRQHGHWRSAEDDTKRCTCPICSKVVTRFKDLNRHVGTHTRPHLCNFCGKSYPNRYSLTNHIKNHNSTENPLKCETCNKTFSTARNLFNHKLIHSGEKPHKCHICETSFRHPGNLTMHMKVHSKEKPFKCTLCDYSCNIKAYLKRHMNIHTLEKIYSCSICFKKFSEKPNLNRHMKMHLSIKNHVCNVCGHRFSQRYYLINHLRIHSKEKPYACPVCNKGFGTRSNMNAHIRSIHPTCDKLQHTPHKMSHNSNTGTQNNVTDSINIAASSSILNQSLHPNDIQPPLHDVVHIQNSNGPEIMIAEPRQSEDTKMKTVQSINPDIVGH